MKVWKYQAIFTRAAEARQDAEQAASDPDEEELPNHSEFPPPEEHMGAYRDPEWYSYYEEKRGAMRMSLNSPPTPKTNTEETKTVETATDPPQPTPVLPTPPAMSTFNTSTTDIPTCDLEEPGAQLQGPACAP